MVLHGIELYLMVLHSFACNCIVSYGIAWYRIDVGSARAVSRKTHIYFIGVVLGVDSRLGYWDLVGGGEIRNMVFFIIFVIIVIHPHSPLIEARTPL